MISYNVIGDTLLNDREVTGDETYNINIELDRNVTGVET